MANCIRLSFLRSGMERIHTLSLLPTFWIMFGAKKGTQASDIAHAVQLHLQKGADNFGEAGLAQGDIATHYDSINCLRIAQWIEEHDVDNGRFWASGFL